MGISTLNPDKKDAYSNPTERILADLRKTFFNDLELLRLEPFRYNNNSFPPYDVFEVGEKEYCIQMALAGYHKDDIEILVEDNKLKISSNKVDSSEELEVKYHHKGIAKRSFSSQFRLPEHAEVTNCVMERGILAITIEINVPEEKLPKVIEIK